MIVINSNVLWLVIFLFLYVENTEIWKLSEYVHFDDTWCDVLTGIFYFIKKLVD